MKVQRKYEPFSLGHSKETFFFNITYGFSVGQTYQESKQQEGIPNMENKNIVKQERARHGGMQTVTSGLGRLRPADHEIATRLGYRKSIEEIIGSDLQGLTTSADRSQVRKSKKRNLPDFCLDSSQATVISAPRGGYHIYTEKLGG